MADPKTEAEADPQWDVPGVPWCYYNPVNDDFYGHETNRSLGYVFWQGNIHRVREKTWWVE